MFRCLNVFCCENFLCCQCFVLGKQRVLDLSQVNPGNEFLKIGKGIPIAVSMFGVAKTFSVANVLCWESSLSSNQAPSKSKCLSQFSLAFNCKRHVADSFTIHTCYGKLCKKSQNWDRTS